MIEAGQRIGYLNETPEQRLARLEELKGLIKSARLRVDANKLATAILESAGHKRRRRAQLLGEH